MVSDETWRNAGSFFSYPRGRTRCAILPLPHHRKRHAGNACLKCKVGGLEKAAPNSRILLCRRVFNNRHIENLFRDFASIKFFLSRDNVREVLVVR